MGFLNFLPSKAFKTNNPRPATIMDDASTSQRRVSATTTPSSQTASRSSHPHPPARSLSHPIDFSPYTTRSPNRPPAHPHPLENIQPAIRPALPRTVTTPQINSGMYVCWTDHQLYRTDCSFRYRLGSARSLRDGDTTTDSLATRDQ